jgi:mono/diheme cytochrome c family protein
MTVAETHMRTTSMALFLACLGSIAVHAADALGRETYVRYCGACHGPEGRGDGIAGTFMRPKPVDFTQIAKGNGGEVPFVRVMETMDGRNTVRAHGDPEMPVWGEILSARANAPTERQSEVRGELMAITDYLQSIQEK